MDDATVVTKKPEKKSARRETAALVKSVREVTRPSLLDIPNKNPTLNYRWMRNTPDNLSIMEAKGYLVANSDQVRAAGLKPSADGAAHKGDLILGVESYAHHREHKQKQFELEKRQQEMMKHGTRRPVRAGGFDFQETARQG